MLENVLDTQYESICFCKHIIDSRIKYCLILYVIYFRVLYSCSLSLWQTLNTLITSSSLVKPHTKTLSRQADRDSEIYYFRFCPQIGEEGELRRSRCRIKVKYISPHT